MTELHIGDPEEEEESLADTEADTTQQSRGAEESLADTEAELASLRESDDGEDD